MSYRTFSKLDPGAIFCPNNPRRQFILRCLAIEGRDSTPANIFQVDEFLKSIEEFKYDAFDKV